MSIVVFLVLAAAVAAVIAYPLLPRRASTPPPSVLTEGDIERAVRELRRSRTARGSSAPGQACPSCGATYQSGDLFCVRCGASLPTPTMEVQPEPEGLVCSNCGASLQAGDQFCAKCGRRVITEGGA